MQIVALVGLRDIHASLRNNLCPLHILSGHHQHDPTVPLADSNITLVIASYVPMTWQ